MSNPVFVDPLLCDTTSLSAALSSAQPDDTIVVTGVVTETVTIDQDVTIRGPTKERTPAWHMGIVQAQATAPTSAQSGSPIFTIDAGVTATIQDLNIRYGRSGAIKNLGTLTLDRVTIYDNRATQGAAIYSSGAMTITNSTLSGNTATRARQRSTSPRRAPWTPASAPSSPTGRFRSRTITRPRTARRPPRTSSTPPARHCARA